VTGSACNFRMTVLTIRFVALGLGLWSLMNLPGAAGDVIVLFRTFLVSVFERPGGSYQTSLRFLHPLQTPLTLWLSYLLAIHARSIAMRMHRGLEHHCPFCGYDMKGIGSAACPECGCETNHHP